MRPFLLPFSAIFFTITNVGVADILRISKVVEAAGEGVEEFPDPNGNGEKLFVMKQVIVGDADVKEARPAPAEEDMLWVTLSDNGEKKIKEATSVMRHGLDRLAILVDGRLISVPVIQTTLGGSFAVSGLDGLDRGKLDDLARRISGRPPRPEGVEPHPPKPLPKPRTVPYTDEEYEQIKKSRERIGVFYLDVLPSDDELKRMLVKGLDRENVRKAFGPPSPFGKRSGPDIDNYFLAPEKILENPEREKSPTGIQIDFDQGKLTTWSMSYDDSRPELEAMLELLIPFTEGEKPLPPKVEGEGDVANPDASEEK